MASTTVNHLNVPLAQEVAAEIQETASLFATQGEQERIRQAELANRTSQPSMVTGLLRKFKAIFI